jgi:hypothetical protein
MRVHRLGAACLGRPIIELIRKGKVVVSCGIGGAGVGVLRDKLILIVVSSGLTLWALVPCRGLMRVRGGRGNWELLVLFVGGCPVMIALCLTADMYSTRRCSGGPRRDPQRRRTLRRSVAFPETASVVRTFSTRSAVDLKVPAPSLTQIEMRVRGSGRAVFTFSVTPDTGWWILR